MQQRNIFLYWIGKEYKLISILRNLIYLHSTNGIGYNVILITPKNVNDYIDDIPDFFYKLCPAHQADYIRVCVLCDHGGIWLDSDTLVLDSLDSLFDIIEKKDGFFINENNNTLCNGVFGSKKETDLMKLWKKSLKDIVNLKKENLGWTDIGSDLLKKMFNYNSNLFKNYKIFQGLNNIYPVNWNNCVTEFITKPYDNYKNIIRDYQPFIILVNSVYKTLENKKINEILNGNMPINYFINKSFDNMKLIDYNFIEIGTSNFDTLIQEADDNTVGISVEAIKHYIDQLPDKKNVKKINMAISDKNTYLDVYYVPESFIDQSNAPNWLKGCNCIGKYHPLHIKHKITNLCRTLKVKVIPCYELFYTNQVRNLDYLKIDTEGHDVIILKSLYSYISYLPTIFYPKKILFESNSNISKNDVDEIIKLFCDLGYKLQSRGHDTILVY